MAMSASGGADKCWSDRVEAVAVAVAGSGVFARERPGIFTMNTMVQGESVGAQACPPGLIRVVSMAQLVVVVVDAMDEADDMWRLRQTKNHNNTLHALHPAVHETRNIPYIAVPPPHRRVDLDGPAKLGPKRKRNSSKKGNKKRMLLTWVEQVTSRYRISTAGSGDW